MAHPYSYFLIILNEKKSRCRRPENFPKKIRLYGIKKGGMGTFIILYPSVMSTRINSVVGPEVHFYQPYLIIPPIAILSSFRYEQCSPNFHFEGLMTWES